MLNLPVVISSPNGDAYLQAGAFEGGWFIGYFAGGPYIITEALTLQSAINQLQNLTQNQLKLTVDHFEIPNLQATDLSEYVTLGFKLMFETTTDVGQAVNQAQLILNSLAASQQKNLYYLDMRFGGKAYVCYQNTACVQNVPITQTATTTP